jgi:hypothetical protein
VTDIKPKGLFPLICFYFSLALTLQDLLFNIIEGQSASSVRACVPGTKQLVLQVLSRICNLSICSFRQRAVQKHGYLLSTQFYAVSGLNRT